MTPHRREELYRGTLTIRNVCEQYGLACEWDEDNGGLIIWADDAPSLLDIVTGNTIEEA
jgi:hypothetical protein